MSPTDPDPRLTVAMYLRAAGLILLALGFLGSIVLARSGTMRTVAAVNAIGFICMIANYWLRRDRMGAALFVLLGVLLVSMQAALL